MHKILLLVVALLASQPALADWRVDAQSSRVSFIATKDVRQVDVGRFYGLLGGVDAEGNVQLKVEIDSLRTGTLLQDQRLQKELFDSTAFAFARVHARLDLAPITNLAPGAQMELSLPATLTLRHVEKIFKTDLLITRLDEHRFQIVTLSPVVLDAADFGLTAAIESLRQSVGLQTVSLAVPVSAVLIFTEH
jgi:hypothetical protein